MKLYKHSLVCNNRIALWRYASAKYSHQKRLKFQAFFPYSYYTKSALPPQCGNIIQKTGNHVFDCTGPLMLANFMKFLSHYDALTPHHHLGAVLAQRLERPLYVRDVFLSNFSFHPWNEKVKKYTSICKRYLNVRHKTSEGLNHSLKIPHMILTWAWNRQTGNGHEWLKPAELWDFVLNKVCCFSMIISTDCYFSP